MLACSRCGHSSEGEARFCSRCGTELDLGVDSPTAIASSFPPQQSPQHEPERAADRSLFDQSGMRSGHAPLDRADRGNRSRRNPGAPPVSSFSGEEPGFSAGAILADRFRIVGRLGRGGMGDVYRADDLKLGQPVALKFLPEAVSRDPDRLRRFLAEVRIARQISHANVCRVYDVMEEEGDHFLSMEYIDGEDLTSLLRRIGKLPADKALELARQICAGLAAAHDRGVLHRDLKPANIMIDGRGAARIADFGLAGTVDEIQGTEIRAGTPGYMAPEQLRGEEVSVRSDVYALGLVLYEMFTGKRALLGRSLPEMLREQTALPSRTSGDLVDLDPAIERVIRRCLQTDPARRPPSALAVSAALPGGDPVAAALAAGELPSPEMVASLGDRTTMPRAVAVACLIVTAIGVTAAALLADRTRLFPLSAPIKPPAVLQERAREMIAELGAWEDPRDRVWGFAIDRPFVQRIQETDSSATRWDSLGSGPPHALNFWYRESPRELVASNQLGQVFAFDPPNTVPGMVAVWLTPQGHLNSWLSVPPETIDSDSTVGGIEWSRIFRLAGLEIGGFEEAEPLWVPPVFADARYAWEGTYPDRNQRLRVEAASLRGRAVYFRLLDPWREPERESDRAGNGVGQAIATSLFILLLVGSVLVAVRNLRLGRGDRKGATRLAKFILVVIGLRFVASAHHVRSIQAEWNLLVFSIAVGLFVAAFTFIMYAALEPYARQHWPELLISWSRALHGRIRDPRVGRDALVGIAAGTILALPSPVNFVVMRALGQTPPTPGDIDLLSLRSGLGALGVLMERAVNGLWIPMVLVLCLLFLKWIVRSSRWAVIVAFALIFTFTGIGSSSVIQWLGSAVTVAGLLFLLLRFGLVSVIAYFFATSVLSSFPITRDVSSWYGPTGLFAIILIVAAAGYAFRLATRSSPGYAMD